MGSTLGISIVDIQAKQPHQFTRYWRSISVVALVAIVSTLQSCEASDKRGAATPDRVVEQYLLALQERDLTAIVQLMPEKSLATERARAKIDRLGGYTVQDRQITYTKPKPTLWNATIRGSYVDRAGIERKFVDAIVLIYESKGQLKMYAGNWYLLL
ncbi:hypothetical protein [Chamaesiphon sp.]|uniref:hypothetical protein n=1 Tax=Chamaesiphon sp. TaxID=2814140 RepID=UPI003593A2FC